MKLMHFSHHPIETIRSIAPAHCGRSDGSKPTGLWVSDEAEGEYGWSTWCKSEEWGLGRIAYAVELSPHANLLHISDVDELDQFHQKFHVRQPNVASFLAGRAIHWSDVAKIYDGILITPYLWDRRLSDHCFWYYGWDCASGCIWNARAIERLVEQVSA